MLMLAHYKFRLRLIQKARQHGKVLVTVDEAYTSKTCSQFGTQHHHLGAAKTFKCPNKVCDAVFDRDVNATKNILLRNVCP
jgi:putative transposase